MLAPGLVSGQAPDRGDPLIHKVLTFFAARRGRLPAGSEIAKPDSSFGSAAPKLESLIFPQFRLSLLSDGQRSIRCSVQRVIGRRLIARVPEALAPGMPVKVDLSNGFALGEVMGSWNDGGQIFSAMQIREWMGTEALPQD